MVGRRKSSSRVHTSVHHIPSLFLSITMPSVPGGWLRPWAVCGWMFSGHRLLLTSSSPGELICSSTRCRMPCPQRQSNHHVSPAWVPGSCEPSVSASYWSHLVQFIFYNSSSIGMTDTHSDKNSVQGMVTSQKSLTISIFVNQNLLTLNLPIMGSGGCNTDWMQLNFCIFLQ